MRESELLQHTHTQGCLAPIEKDVLRMEKNGGTKRKWETAKLLLITNRYMPYHYTHGAEAKIALTQFLGIAFVSSFVCVCMPIHTAGCTSCSHSVHLLVRMNTHVCMCG
mgnify:CR=1 FL=1